MTPLSRFFARILPAPLAVLSLALAYALMLCAIVFAGSDERDPIIYVDVRGS